MLLRLMGATAGGALILALLILLMDHLIQLDTTDDAVSAARVMRFSVAPREPTMPPLNPVATAEPRLQDQGDPLPELRSTLLVRPRLPPSPEFIPTNAGPSSLLRAGIQETADGPTVEIDPIYPQQALTRGLEGHVLLEYTVESNGAVSDIVVVDSSDPVFIAAATEALSRARFDPPINDDVPAAVQGVRLQIDFVLVD